MGPFNTHRFLMRAALSIAHVFAWIFVFQYFYFLSRSLIEALVAASFSYALAQTVAILLTPYTARRLRHGVRGMLINAMLALAAAFAVLATAFAGRLGSIAAGIILFSIFMGIYRSLYWIPYEVAAKKHHGTTRYSELLLALLPAVSGFVISLGSNASVFLLVGAAIIALLAIVPIYAIRNTHEGYSWHYRETFRHLFTASHRRPLLQAVFNGFEGAALLLLWPIAIFVLLNSSYAALGLVMTATYVCTLVARMFLPHVHKTVESPVVLSVLTLSGWMLRGTVAAPFSIVLVDTYYQSGSGVSQRGVDMVTAEQSADSNTYIDEFTALKDMGQGIGRIAFCVTLFFLSLVFSFATLILAMFLIAAILGVVSIVLNRRVRRHSFAQ